MQPTTSNATSVAADWQRDAARASDSTLDALFRRAFSVFGDRIAVSWEDGQRSYRELGERAWRLANAMQAKGYNRGDTIAILSETRPEYVECYAAMAALGVTVATLNIRLRPEEIAVCLRKARPDAVLTSGPLAGLIDNIRSDFAEVRDWIAFEPAKGFESYEAILAAGAESEPPRIAEGEDIHNILFTSGTTGQPKAALVSQRAAAVRGLRLAQWFGLTENDGFIGWLPLFHCGGDESLYATLVSGGIYATFKRVDIKAMYERIERERLSWTLLLPGVITDFMNNPQQQVHDLSSLRFAIGYANMMPNVVAKLTETFGIDFYDAFGQSESSYLLAHGRSGPGQMPSLRKQPSPLMEVRIVDEDMNDMPVGQPGECVVRGPSVMSGYLDDDAANAEVFKGGWLHTGDLLRREEDGTLTFVDRKKYLIKTGGENVYPAEVEAVLSRHAAVQEACVFGVSDPHWGETIKAVVVLRHGQAADIADIVGWCRQQLAGFKRPRYLQFMRSEELPRSTTGKLQRHELARLPLEPEQRVG
jgi:acyl-CoA synthetase (AMP-forming)/AMP-acid ligase II